MAALQRFAPRWHQTMLRIADPARSIEYYRKHFGFTLLDEYHCEEAKRSHYYLATLTEAGDYPHAPGSAAAHEYLWGDGFKGVALELMHEHGKKDFVPNSGNVEPHRGFGHIAVLCDDVYAASAALEAGGVRFHKRPDEGRMKGLAFALDPDGYWVEIIARPASHDLKIPFNLAQTMLRVKSPSTPEFFEKYFGMVYVRKSDYPAANFSNFFMADLTPDQRIALAAADGDVDKLRAFQNSLPQPILELTHNHGTEKEEGPVYHNGNTDPVGFGHIGFLVNELDAFVAYLKDEGVAVVAAPGPDRTAVVTDPTGYHIELIERGVARS